MSNPVESLLSFMKYWYFRYTLVTELYMVERWERNFISILYNYYNLNTHFFFLINLIICVSYLQTKEITFFLF